jgi:hypothetical protein
MSMRWTYLPPAAYLAFAVFVWIDFAQTSQDGLANLGLLLATYPVAALGVALTWALGQTGFVLIPSGVDYYTAHAVYFWPSALMTAFLLYVVCSAPSWIWRNMMRIRRRGSQAGSGLGFPKPTTTSPGLFPSGKPGKSA